MPATGLTYLFRGYRRGHFQRALEEAISAHYNQWPSAWSNKNPLHGGNNFNNMSPEQRVRIFCSMADKCSTNIIQAYSTEDFDPLVSQLF